ncbi:uncharacterized protein EI90DRAFT_3032261 [Cantharellus anzutake]|uniref:uncharacterized protein n=1 Tax=Cantharellus anzutake TaxID=1750568 RepID=UPI001906DEE8|nr:uncharacterized protein EI90DRAFT_3032261 [Cantharellus anzutake]KAF8342143.1 hypothetical protein EI90DRAFT_3032261 [Cantharellus anzutake]
MLVMNLLVSHYFAAGRSSHKLPEMGNRILQGLDIRSRCPEGEFVNIAPGHQPGSFHIGTESC